MNQKLVTLVAEFRKPSFYGKEGGIAEKMFVTPLVQALDQARREITRDAVLQAFKDAGGEFVREDEYERRSADQDEECGLFVVCRADETCRDIDDILGDGYDVDYLVNKEGWRRKHAEKAREEAIDRVNQDGVWGYTTHFRDASGEWQDGEWSCWGFIGDDFMKSGYEVDACSTVLVEFQEANAEAEAQDDSPLLCNYRTGEILGKASQAQLKESKAAGHEGVIVVSGVSCYVVN